ncbi:MAG: hypothetical protein PHW24_00880 [Candidatus Moranbacteria bacterium]|nr:hypothetical protein [Candidatus Moranbacteria bacterium]
MSLIRKNQPEITRPEFFIEVCMKGSADLRKILKIDESQYNFIHHRGVTKSQSYFLYSAMNEVEKAGISIMQAEEFIGNDGKEIDENDRLTKNIIQSIQDEQFLKIRKMTELLTELVLFSKINTDVYYRHYMLIKELKSLKDTIKNAKNAYGCHIQNYQKQLEDIMQEISSLETSPVDISKCWYLANGKKGRVTGIKGVLSSFEERINTAFGIANPNQIIALGTSFEEGYGNFSNAVHFNAVVGAHVSNVSLQGIRANMSGMGILAANIIIQARILFGDRRRSGYASFLSKIFRNSNQAEVALNKHTKPNIQKGDFVNAQGELAEVLKIMKGKYGFRSFRVRFLLKEDTEVAGKGDRKTVWTHKNPEFEEYPAMWVRKLYSRKEILDSIKKEILKHDSNANIRTQKLVPFIRKSVIHMWENVGLKESVHGKKEQALEKVEQERERIRRSINSVS